MDQWAHHQPKGVPRHVRQTFDYFIFTATASPTDKENDEKVKRPGGNPPGTAGSTPLPSAPAVASSHPGQQDADAGVETARPFVGAADVSPTAEQAQKVQSARMLDDLRGARDIYRAASDHSYQTNLCTSAKFATVSIAASLRHVPPTYRITFHFYHDSSIIPTSYPV